METNKRVASDPEQNTIQYVPDTVSSSYIIHYSSTIQHHTVLNCVCLQKESVQNASFLLLLMLLLSHILALSLKPSNSLALKTASQYLRIIRTNETDVKLETSYQRSSQTPRVTLESHLPYAFTCHDLRWKEQIYHLFLIILLKL